MELTPVGNSNNCNLQTVYISKQENNGDDAVGSSPEASSLLSVQVSMSNGEINQTVHTSETRSSSNTNKKSSVCHVMDQLSQVVFWKVRLWMVIIFIFLLIFIVIAISLLMCTVIHEDVDETYDVSLFKIPLFFNGSFLLSNQNFTADLLSPSSIQHQALSTQLKKKLADLYAASPALGRYFSNTEIHAFRNGSVIAEYQLTFLVPVEHVELEKFTLSREVVYNVFRQFLYDQDKEETLYIDPASLEML